MNELLGVNLLFTIMEGAGRSNETRDDEFSLFPWENNQTWPSRYGGARVPEHRSGQQAAIS